MGLITCPECQKEVYGRALVDCRGCGSPSKMITTDGKYLEFHGDFKKFSKDSLEICVACCNRVSPNKLILKQ